MDFISNLIKRPISLVLNETSTTMDKYPISASLPNTPSRELENKKDSLPTTPTNKQQQELTYLNQINHNNKRPLSLSSSCNSVNMTDFIGVPEDFLDEFKDILPPPPLSLQNTNSSTQSILDMENTDCLSITPPPPPPFDLNVDKEPSLLMTPSMKPQTIDELLLQITDNLQQAGLNDDILPIATPSNKSELSPLSSKAALNNSKLLNSSSISSASNLNTTFKTSSTTAAGPAGLTVFENNTPLHKFHNDPDLKIEQMFDQGQQATRHQLNCTGGNNSSNKFLGLTEFDETKIPELLGDLNPGIEDQYSVTFEECFIPTLNAQQGTTTFDEFKVDKTHLLLPTEMDAISSDNETFADCHDEKDPLTTTFTEPPSLDVTEVESFQSATNRSLNSDFNNTMDDIADMTMEAEIYLLNKTNQTKVVHQQSPQNEFKQSKLEAMDDDEPMDVDMNDTMEIVQNTSNNIQVLQHAKDILQQPEINTAERSDLLEKQIQPSPTAYCTPIDSSECIYENLDCDVPQNENVKPSEKDQNLTNESVNSSTSSNTSDKSVVNGKTKANLNLTSDMNSSINFQKTTAPNSPTFPIKSKECTGFPHSPKVFAGEKPIESPFLEKSDYTANLETQAAIENQTNESFDKSSWDIKANNLNSATLEAVPAELGENNKRRTFGVENSVVVKKPTEEEANNIEFNKNSRRTFSIDKSLTEDRTSDENCRSFNVKSDEVAATTLTQFPFVAKTDKRRTFSLREADDKLNEEVLDTCKSDLNSRRTFNVPLEECTEKSNEQTELNKSFEPMDLDDTLSQNSTSPMAALFMKEISNSPPLPAGHNKAQSPPLPTVQPKSQSPPLPTMQAKSQLPPLPTMQPKSQSSPPLPTMQAKSQSISLPRSQSPPLPTMQSKSQSPPLPIPQTRSSHSSPIHNESSPPSLSNTTQKQSEIELNPKSLPDSTSPPTPVNIKEEPFESKSTLAYTSQPLPALIQKRPSIRDSRTADILSAKEQTNIKAKDEKDIFVEQHTPSPVEDVYTAVTATSTTLTNSSNFSEFNQTSSSSASSLVNNAEEQASYSQQFEDEFSGNNNLILNPSDFDYLLTKGNNTIPGDRSSLLLKFDPLLGVPVPVNQGQQQQLKPLQLQLSANTNNPYLCPTLEEEDEHNESNHSIVIDNTKSGAGVGVGADSAKQQLQKLDKQVQQNKRQLTQGTDKKNATMSVDVIKDMSLDNDCNKAFENSNSTQSDDKQIDYKMDELEKKIKNEVLKTEDIEKKLKDAEQREEALIKRITEKDKTIAKMTGVIEAYEKAIAELIADKEQLTQHYEQQLAEVKADRDSNYHHLTSLETTFSDLHVKYEKSKEMTCQLKESEEALLAEKRKNLDNLHLQEQRYDKMKNHAMQQLEIANKKLESLTREHSIEITKLKALLKKEEIARSSINEQLAHKTKENAELVKICDELISGQGIS